MLLRTIKTLSVRSIRALPSGRWSDQVIALLEFVSRHRRLPHLREPVLFNDWLLKLKIDGSLSDPLRQFVTDKEYMKYYVAGVVGKDYTLETFEVLRTKDDVDRFSVSRAPCVIKPTHMSGPVLICLDHQTPIDRAMLHRWLNTDYYRKSREANYRYLQPKVIIEEFFSCDGQTVPQDYKVFCFHGQPQLIEVDAGRFVKHTRNFYDTSWNRLRITVRYPAGESADSRPANLEVMLEIARKLSKPFPSVRVDMYAHGDTIKVGELTNCHGGGGELVRPTGAEEWLGGLFAGRSGSFIAKD